MTQLENKIYLCALKSLPEIRDSIKDVKTKTKAKYIQIPFECDGCLDMLIYDTSIGIFTKIEYTKGVGEPIFSENIGESANFYDKTERCTIDISNKNLK